MKNAEILDLLHLFIQVFQLQTLVDPNAIPSELYIYFDVRSQFLSLCPCYSKRSTIGAQWKKHCGPDTYLLQYFTYYRSVMHVVNANGYYHRVSWTFSDLSCPDYHLYNLYILINCLALTVMLF